MSPADALLAEARTAEDAGEPERAIDLVKSFLELEPTTPVIWSWLGRMQDSLSRHEEAAKSFRRAVELDENYASAHGLLAATLYLMGQMRDALVSSQHAVSLEATAGRWVIHGCILAAMGRVGEAEVAFRNAIALEPDFDEALYHLAMCTKSRSPATAIELLRRASAIDPHSATTLRDLGCLLLDQEDIGGARDALGRALNLDGNDPSTLAYLGLLEHRSGRLREAAELYEKARIVAQQPTTLAMIGSFLHQLDQNASAELAFQRAIELEPGAAEWAYKYARFLWWIGRVGDAKVALARALALDPLHEKALELSRQVH